MKKKMNIATPCRIIAIMIGAGLLFAGHDSAAQEEKTSELSIPAAVYSTKETATFIALTKETLDALAAGKSTEMVAKLTDLETAWDDDEEMLQPRDTATWTLLDKTLDKAISALRSSRINIPKGKAALNELLRMLQQATKP